MKWLLKLFRTTDERILDLQTEVQVMKRQLEVAQTEIDSLAAVIARDRSRVEAETAIFNRKKASAEGQTQNEQLGQSVREF